MCYNVVIIILTGNVTRSRALRETRERARMHIFLWLGMFFIGGGILCAVGALYMKYGKNVREVEAEVVSVREPEEIAEENRRTLRQRRRAKKPEKPSDGPAADEGGNDPDDDAEEAEDTLRETVFAFDLDGERKEITAHVSARAEVGEKGRMYYDLKTGLIYSRRVFLTLWLACGVFCTAGILTIVLERVLTA